MTRVHVIHIKGLLRRPLFWFLNQCGSLVNIFETESRGEGEHVTLMRAGHDVRPYEKRFMTGLSVMLPRTEDDALRFISRVILELIRFSRSLFLEFRRVN
jgi:hypothetical protein